MEVKYKDKINILELNYTTDLWDFECVDFTGLKNSLIHYIAGLLISDLLRHQIVRVTHSEHPVSPQ